MNTKATASSSAGAAMRMLALGGWLAIALAACGKSQNYLDHDPAYVKIGGSVTGLNGTLVLQNNAGDNLAVSASGSFTFGLQIANGATYKATIKTQPTGQVCAVSNGSGTARADVSSIAVNCLSDVTIGGTISGLTGTVVLQNNGANPLATASDGPFTFTAKIAPGSSYAVTVRTQPTGLTCFVANGFGTAAANVTNVAVTCSVFTIRPLPAIYMTAKAVNYSPYRTSVPPGGGGDPTDGQVIQDLGLLQGAGFTLLRTFASDAVGEQIVRLAESNYPALKIHLGVFLEGATASCVDAVNTTGIANLIRLANLYTNVVAVSVGNETSFAANLPVQCLASYIQTVRSQVTQPVTADDDYSFYAGLTASGEKPDTIIPLLDFVSIHIYAFTESGNWDWQQTGIATLYPDRASAMMNASMTYTRSKYDLVANRSYTTASGATTTIGASLPIVIGETGWKAGRPNGAYRPPVPIENYSFSATPPAPVSEINNKWFYDLSNAKASWSTAPAAAPKTIFFFEAFDEPWKKDFIYSPGDDGWGLWDVARTPRYALCGTYAAAPACASPDVYLGAGYYH